MTNEGKLVLLIAAGVGLAALAAEGATVGLAYWESSANAKKWAPVIAAAEQQYGIPTGLLARQAYEESGYRTSVINGTQSSPAGALGILQLMPQYFSSVQVPIPFSDGAIEGQIAQAAGYMHQLYQEFGNWPAALAAYNAGPGTVSQYLAAGGAGAGLSLPAQTVNYVTQILADVPAAGSAQSVLG